MARHFSASWTASDSIRPRVVEAICQSERLAEVGQTERSSKNDKLIRSNRPKRIRFDAPVADFGVQVRSLDECFLVEDYFASNALELYVFARISQVYAEARKLFSRLSPIVNGENATVLDSILNPQRNLRNSVLPSVIQNAEDLDAYWAEFGVTGLCDCILRIVDVLDWPDIGRSILELAINGRGSLRLQSCDWQSLVDAGIARRNSDGFQLNRIGDTDILLCDALRSGNIGAKSVFEQLSLEKSNYMATKSAAFWSLKSNSQFDDIVRECCTLAASKPGGDSRKLLFDQSRDNES